MIEIKFAGERRDARSAETQSSHAGDDADVGATMARLGSARLGSARLGSALTLFTSPGARFTLSHHGAWRC